MCVERNRELFLIQARTEYFDRRTLATETNNGALRRYITPILTLQVDYNNITNDNKISWLKIDESLANGPVDCHGPKSKSECPADMDSYVDQGQNLHHDKKNMIRLDVRT